MRVEGRRHLLFGLGLAHLDARDESCVGAERQVGRHQRHWRPQRLGLHDVLADGGEPVAQHRRLGVAINLVGNLRVPHTIDEIARLVIVQDEPAERLGGLNLVVVSAAQALELAPNRQRDRVGERSHLRLALLLRLGRPGSKVSLHLALECRHHLQLRRRINGRGLVSVLRRSELKAHSREEQRQRVRGRRLRSPICGNTRQEVQLVIRSRRIPPKHLVVRTRSRLAHVGR
eukprot:6017508-Pleurochrysis_carterae.AAC.1